MPDRILLSHESLASAIGDRWSSEELSAAAELLAESEGQFPPGTKALPPDLISAVQRERLLAAIIRAVAEIGYPRATVQDVIDRAGVSRPTFYQHFENKEDCFLAAFDAIAARLRERVDAAVAGAGPHWRDRLRAGLEELLRFIEAEPEMARGIVVEARAAGPPALRHRDELLEGFAACLEAQVREELAEPPSGIAAAGIVGGIESVLYSRIQRGGDEELRSLLPSLMYFAVLPYGGQEAAAEELSGASPS